MIRRPPRSTRTDTRFPYTTLFRSLGVWCEIAAARSSPYQAMQIWEHDPRAALRFDASDVRATQLGTIVERSEEHTFELQSLMRISYAVFCLKKKKKITIYIKNRRRTKNSYKKILHITPDIEM